MKKVVTSVRAGQAQPAKPANGRAGISFHKLFLAILHYLLISLLSTELRNEASSLPLQLTAVCCCLSRKMQESAVRWRFWTINGKRHLTTLSCIFVQKRSN